MSQILPAYPDQPWFQSAAPASRYRKIAVERVSGACGAVISGANGSRLDLARADAETIAEIKLALLDAGAVFFRDQGHLTNAEYEKFASNFGEISEYPMLKGVAPEHPNITVIEKMEAETVNFGGGWHSDTTYLTVPPKYTILLAREMPETGGDTLFANQYLAYETLTPSFKKMIDGLNVVTTNLTPGAIQSRAARVSDSGTDTSQNAKELKAVHPLVRQHPETGRRALFTNGGHTVRIEGWGREESLALLQFLWAWAVKPEYQCRWNWKRAGALAIWDNRAVMHNAVNDYHGIRRVMHRITIKGDVPRHHCPEAPPYVQSNVAGGLIGAKM